MTTSLKKMLFGTTFHNGSCPSVKLLNEWWNTVGKTQLWKLLDLLQYLTTIILISPI